MQDEIEMQDVIEIFALQDVEASTSSKLHVTQVLSHAVGRRRAIEYEVSRSPSRCWRPRGNRSKGRQVQGPQRRQG